MIKMIQLMIKNDDNSKSNNIDIKISARKREFSTD